MEKFATENLILLEFLVDQINLEYNVKQDLQMMGETCVSFQFLDNAPLLVCEEDFVPKKRNYGNNCGGCDGVKNGKSCLFSMTPEQAMDAFRQFDIHVEVYKKTKPGTLPDKVLLGESLISIVNLFKEMMESVSHGESATAKTLKDCFQINNTMSGDLVGHISVYIRMSCFGKLIVTQFQMNLEDKSVEFKAKQGHYLFKYNKKEGSFCPSSCKLPSAQSSMPSCCMPPSNNQQQYGQTSPGGWNQPPCYQPPPCMEQSYKHQRPPSAPCTMQLQSQYHHQQGCKPQPPCMPQPLCMQQQHQQQQPPCMQQPQPPCMPPPQQPPCMPPPQPPQVCMPALQEVPCNECQEPSIYPSEDSFQEIGASMGGNALRIRVHKESTKVEQCDNFSLLSDRQLNCPIPTCPFNETPSEEMEICPATKRKPKTPSPARQQQQHRKPTCNCSPPEPQQTKLSMRTGNDDGNVPFNFNVTGCCPSNNVSIIPPTCTLKDGTQVTEISDPKKEVFVLKIGKKSEGSSSKKKRLELELCTPKGKEIKPPPKMESRDSQYEVSDFPDGYLENFYGKDKWKKMAKDQGGFGGKGGGAGGGRGGKGGKGGGGRGGGGKGGKGGGGGRRGGGGGGGDDDDDDYDEDGNGGGGGGRGGKGGGKGGRGGRGGKGGNGKGGGDGKGGGKDGKGNRVGIGKAGGVYMDKPQKPQRACHVSGSFEPCSSFSPFSRPCPPCRPCSPCPPCPSPCNKPNKFSRCYPCKTESNDCCW